MKNERAISSDIVYHTKEEGSFTKIKFKNKWLKISVEKGTTT